MLEADEVRAVLSKLKGWVVDGPEKEALDRAEAKLVKSITGDKDGTL